MTDKPKCAWCGRPAVGLAVGPAVRPGYQRHVRPACRHCGPDMTTQMREMTPIEAMIGVVTEEKP